MNKRGILLRQLIKTIIRNIFLDDTTVEKKGIKINDLTIDGGKVVSRMTYHRVLKSLCEVGVLYQKGKLYFLTDDFKNEIRNNIAKWENFKGISFEN